MCFAEAQSHLPSFLPSFHPPSPPSIPPQRSSADLSDEEDGDFGRMVVGAEQLVGSMGRLGVFVTSREAEALIGRWTKSKVPKGSSSKSWSLSFHTWRKIWCVRWPCTPLGTLRYSLAHPHRTVHHHLPCFVSMFYFHTNFRYNRIKVDEEKWLRSLRVWWGPDAPPDGIFGTGASAEGGAIATVGDWLDRVASRMEKQNYKKLMSILSRFERETGLAQAGAFGIANHAENPELTLPLGSTLKCIIRFEV